MKNVALGNRMVTTTSRVEKFRSFEAKKNITTTRLITKWNQGPPRIRSYRHYIQHRVSVTESCCWVSTGSVMWHSQETLAAIVSLGASSGGARYTALEHLERQARTDASVMCWSHPETRVHTRSALSIVVFVVTPTDSLLTDWDMHVVAQYW